MMESYCFTISLYHNVNRTTPLPHLRLRPHWSLARWKMCPWSALSSILGGPRKDMISCWNWILRKHIQYIHTTIQQTHKHGAERYLPRLAHDCRVWEHQVSPLKTRTDSGMGFIDQCQGFDLPMISWVEIHISGVHPTLSPWSPQRFWALCGSQGARPRLRLMWRIWTSNLWRARCGFRVYVNLAEGTMIYDVGMAKPRMNFCLLWKDWESFDFFFFVSHLQSHKTTFRARKCYESLLNQPNLPVFWSAVHSSCHARCQILKIQRRSRLAVASLISRLFTSGSTAKVQRCPQFVVHNLLWPRRVVRKMRKSRTPSDFNRSLGQAESRPTDSPRPRCSCWFLVTLRVIGVDMGRYLLKLKLWYGLIWYDMVWYVMICYDSLSGWPSRKKIADAWRVMWSWEAVKSLQATRRRSSLNKQDEDKVGFIPPHFSFFCVPNGWFTLC